METTAKINWTRISNDGNGNPRYVCHFLDLLTSNEMSLGNLTWQYSHAVNRAHKLGGRKFHNKQYGGGIVFQSYNIQDLEQRLLALIK